MGNIHIAVLTCDSWVLPMTDRWNWRGSSMIAIIESQVSASQSPYEEPGRRRADELRISGVGGGALEDVSGAAERPERDEDADRQERQQLDQRLEGDGGDQALGVAGMSRGLVRRT